MKMLPFKIKIKNFFIKFEDKNFRRGISTLIGACCINFLAGAIFSLCTLSIYEISYIKAKGGSITIDHLTFYYPIEIIFQCISAFFSGHIYKELGLHITNLIGTTILTFGYFLMFISSSLILDLLSMIIGGIGTGIIFYPSTTNAYEWFKDHNGIIVGIMETMISFGSFFFAFLGEKIINKDEIPSNDEDNLYDFEIGKRIKLYLIIQMISLVSAFIISYILMYVKDGNEDILKDIKHNSHIIRNDTHMEEEYINKEEIILENNIKKSDSESNQKVTIDEQKEEITDLIHEKKDTDRNEDFEKEKINKEIIKVEKENEINNKKENENENEIQNENKEDKKEESEEIKDLKKNKENDENEKKEMEEEREKELKEEIKNDVPVKDTIIKEKLLSEKSEDKNVEEKKDEDNKEIIDENKKDEVIDNNNIITEKKEEPINKNENNGKIEDLSDNSQKDILNTNCNKNEKEKEGILDIKEKDEKINDDNKETIKDEKEEPLLIKTDTNEKTNENELKIKKKKKKMKKLLKLALKSKRLILFSIIVILQAPVANMAFSLYREIGEYKKIDTKYLQLIGSLYFIFECLSSFVFGILCDYFQLKYLLFFINGVGTFVGFIYCLTFKNSLIFFLVQNFLSFSAGGYYPVKDCFLMKVYGKDIYIELSGYVSFLVAISVNFLTPITYFVQSGLEEKDLAYWILFILFGTLNLIGLILNIFLKETPIDLERNLKKKTK